MTERVVIPPPAAPTAPEACSDGDLVARYQAGDESAAGSLHARYARRLRALAGRYCRKEYAGRFDADDIVQSAFRAFFQGVRERGYAATEGGEIWDLLTVLALSKVRNQVGFHTAGRRDVRQTEAVPDLDAARPADRDETAAVVRQMVLDEHLAELPEADRAIVRLRLEGHEVKEIAARTGRARRTVERVLHDFRARLSDL